jgi:c-di-GMP-binding flagellar brake protein YcgR
VQFSERREQALHSFKAVRKHPRYALDVRVKLFAEGEEISARTLDISEGGLGLVSPVVIAEGKHYIVKLELPGISSGLWAEVFEAEIRQQSRSGFRHGFEFVSLSEESRGLLRRYLRRCGVPAKEGYAGA